MLELAIDDAQKLKADQLRMPDDPGFGARAIKVASNRLKAARRFQKGLKDSNVYGDDHEEDVRAPDEDVALQKQFDVRLTSVAEAATMYRRRCVSLSCRLPRVL